jgi:DNA-binding MarR family transcriptional regulator
MAMTTSLASAEADRRGIFNALQLIETFRELHPEMPMQLASVFLIIAMRPGISQRDLLGLMDISQASISRNVIALTSRNRRGQPGLGLVVQRRDPYDSRLTTIDLTSAGQQLIDRILASGRSGREPQRKPNDPIDRRC